MASDTPTTTAKTDTVRLANIKAFVTDPARMTEWDMACLHTKGRRRFLATRRLRVHFRLGQSGV
jgi:hypothetical protein